MIIIKRWVLIGLALLLSACGGGGGTSPSVPTNTGSGNNNGGGNAQKFDLLSYMTHFRPNHPGRFYYEKYYYFEDGTPAWFGRFGDPASEPVTDEEREETFKALKVGVLKVVDLDKVFSKLKPPHDTDIPGFISNDSYYLGPRPTATQVSISRETYPKLHLKDTIVLDKYNWKMPRFVDNNETILFGSINTDPTRNVMTGAEESDPHPKVTSEERCKFVFKSNFNLYDSVTHLAKNKSESKVLIQTCHLYPRNSDRSIGYRTIYYAKGTGEIHRVTSYGQGVVHHVIKNRAFYPYTLMRQ